MSCVYGIIAELEMEYNIKSSRAKTATWFRSALCSRSSIKKSILLAFFSSHQPFQQNWWQQRKSYRSQIVTRSESISFLELYRIAIEISSSIHRLRVSIIAFWVKIAHLCSLHSIRTNQSLTSTCMCNITDARWMDDWSKKRHYKCYQLLSSLHCNFQNNSFSANHVGVYWNESFFFFRHSYLVRVR